MRASTRRELRRRSVGSRRRTLPPSHGAFPHVIQPNPPDRRPGILWLFIVVAERGAGSSSTSNASTRRPGGPDVTDIAPWPWTKSPGGLSAPNGGLYRIRRILFGTVGERCRELGLREGETVRLRGRNHDGVQVELRSGEVKRIDLTYAWFVEVELGQPETRES